MTVKIDGTNGIDTAQLRAPDGDPVAMTIDNAGKVAFPQGGSPLAFAWCVFGGAAASPITPTTSFNVTNVTKVSTGVYRINLTTPLTNANCCVVAMSEPIIVCNLDTGTTGYVTVKTVTLAQVAVDAVVSVLVFGR